MANPQHRFTALILAADRGPDDPVARAAGVSCKCLTPVSGRPMVFHVLSSLDASQEVNLKILCGPPQSILDQEADLRDLVATGKVKWFVNQATPSSSAYHVLQTLPDEVPVLLTTADHALLTTRMVDHFCGEAKATGCDVVMGIARHEVVLKAYPQTRRTATRLEDGAYCGCNLFAFLTPRARQAADFWRQVEAQRKSPLRVIKVLGWTAVSRYLMGRLSLAGALERVSRRLGFKAGVVIMPFAEAAVDVDSVEDWKLVERIMEQREMIKPFELNKPPG